MHDQSMEVCGLYRDKTRLIIDLQNYQFPKKCLISGKRVESEPLPITFYTWAVPPRGVESFGINIVKSTWWLGPIQVISLVILAVAISVSSSPTATVSAAASFVGRSRILGISLLVLGTLIAVAGSILTAIGWIAWQWHWTLVPLCLVVGLVVSILGIVLLERKNWPLRIHRVDCGFAWLDGVHASLLDPLPTWRNSSAYKAYRQTIGYRRLMLGGVACVIGSIPIVTEFQTIADSVSSRQWLATQGAISSSNVTTTYVKTGRNIPARSAFVAEVKYTFRVAGAMYTGNRINFEPQAIYSNREFASRVCEWEYPVGEPVAVFYHANDPERCALKIATWGDIQKKTGLSLVAFAVGAWGLISGLAKFRRSN